MKNVQVTDMTNLPVSSLLPLDADTQILVQTNRLIQDIFIRVNFARLWLIIYSAGNIF